MKRFLLILSLILFARGALAAPVETELTVRVQAHDAKFIGSGVGEMNVVVEDADTGALLASGRVSGGTGDTDRLMKTPVARGATLSDEKTAAYTARLMLERSVRVRIRAIGPLAEPDAVQETSVTTWVVPGRAIGGDGIVLRLPGLIVTPEFAPAIAAHYPSDQATGFAAGDLRGAFVIEWPSRDTGERKP